MKLERTGCKCSKDTKEERMKAERSLTNSHRRRCLKADHEAEWQALRVEKKRHQAVRS